VLVVEEIFEKIVVIVVEQIVVVVVEIVGVGDAD